MPQITLQSACPVIAPGPLVAPTCLVFSATTQKIAEARLPGTALIITTLGAPLTALITALLPAGVVLTPAQLTALLVTAANALLRAGAVTIDACLTSTMEPRLEGHLLRDKIINCGDVNAVVTVVTTAPLAIPLVLPTTPPTTITITVPAGLTGCTVVTLTIQAEQVACNVRPTDCIIEQVTDFEGAATCIVGGTTTDPVTGGLINTTLVLVKASFEVLQQVVRVVLPTLPPCPPPISPACT